jgi:hypothetical protein
MCSELCKINVSEKCANSQPYSPVVDRLPILCIATSIASQLAGLCASCESSCDL